MQDASDVIPRLLHCLHRLPFCSASSKSPGRLQTNVTLLFSKLSKLISLEQFPSKGRSDISEAIVKLLILAVEGPFQQKSGKQTDAVLLTALRAAISHLYHSSAGLPLMPEHAVDLLSYLRQQHLASDRPKDGLVSSNSSSILLLLTAQLCKVVLRSKALDAKLAQQIAMNGSRCFPLLLCCAMLYFARYCQSRHEASRASSRVLVSCLHGSVVGKTAVGPLYATSAPNVFNIRKSTLMPLHGPTSYHP